uniref:Uncharacterized protein n=1 Tax=Panagrolaimus sp. JU765 TaxID=591449 RepID=A0AC34Q0D9_9BILA
MIGMMNAGGESPADFYSTPKLGKGVPRLYTPQKREKVSYTKDGRMMLDGQLVVTETPEELWTDLIMRVVWYMCCKDFIPEKEIKMPKTRKFRNFFKLRTNQKPPQEKSITTVTTTNSTDPKTGFKTITSTTTTTNGKNCQKSTFTSVFLKKHRFCSEPHSKRITGQ